MSKTTLQIEQSAAITAYENAKKSGKRMLEDLFGKKNLVKDVREKYKVLDDILEEYGYSAASWAASCVSRNLTERQIGMEEVEMIVECFNHREKPDFTNSDQSKHYPIFEIGSPSGVGFRLIDVDCRWTHSAVGARLVYLCDYDTTRYAVETFIESYKKAYTK